MTSQTLHDIPAWQKLLLYAKTMQRPEKHLKNLLQDKDRFEKLCLFDSDFFYDFSRQRVDEKCMSLLLELAEARNLKQRFNSMASGEKINITENRAALHTASRSFSGKSIFVNNVDVMPEIRKVRDDIKEFASNVHEKKITGSTGKPFKHVVVIGIGGSCLGSEFVSNALNAYADKGIEIHYLSNVDIHNFGEIVLSINPETTMWIVISKSYTTAETMANANLAVSFMKDKGLDPARHFVTITSKGSPGDNSDSSVLRSFHMFDFIGGRYSVTSAVGGVPLSLLLGYDRFERFLKGAEEMDNHARHAPAHKNLPLIAAMIGIWNNNFLGYQHQAIIPYAFPLNRLASHVQQLYMESNGKSVTERGNVFDESTGVIVFGEPGTNAQHSFFQLAHQGRPLPIDFIGVINPHYKKYHYKSMGVTNHQELWANLIAQPMALAVGKDDSDMARCFSGNRPSSTILLNDLSPESIGRLLAFYEAKTVFEAFAWGINPFDQFGVELGKTMASGIRNEMAKKNEKSDYNFEGTDHITRFYLDKLFSGKLKPNS